jgi:hypothetical protein
VIAAVRGPFSRRNFTMAEDCLGFRFLKHDEMIFKADEGALRDASLKLMKEVGYGGTSGLVEMKTMPEDHFDAGHMFVEGTDFHLF